MQPAIGKDSLERLVALGRERGHLTPDDLRAALPVDAMDAQDIALVVVHLEEAGVPVELDDALLAGPSRPMAVPTPGPELVLPVAPPGRPVEPPLPAASLAAGPAPLPPDPAPARRGPSVHWAVALAGLGVLVLLVLAVLA